VGDIFQVRHPFSQFLEPRSDTLSSFMLGCDMMDSLFVLAEWRVAFQSVLFLKKDIKGRESLVLLEFFGKDRNLTYFLSGRALVP
jgi:hypothetical protein